MTGTTNRIPVPSYAFHILSGSDCYCMFPPKIHETGDKTSPLFFSCFSRVFYRYNLCTPRGFGEAAETICDAHHECSGSNNCTYARSLNFDLMCFLARLGAAKSRAALLIFAMFVFCFLLMCSQHPGELNTVGPLCCRLGFRVYTYSHDGSGIGGRRCDGLVVGLLVNKLTAVLPGNIRRLIDIFTRSCLTALLGIHSRFG